MTKKKEPFKITGPGVYSTRLKVLVEIIGRPYRHLDPPFDPAKSGEPWVGVRMGQSDPGIIEVSAWNDDGIEGYPINESTRIGSLIRREISFDTKAECKAEEERIAELKYQQKAMTEAMLRRNVLDAFRCAHEEYGFDGDFKRTMAFKELFARQREIGVFIRMALGKLDNHYEFALGHVGDTFNTLEERPGKKGGLPKMANAEDVVIYVADRLGIPLKNKPWCEPTIKLPVKKAVTKPQSNTAPVTPEEAESILKAVAKKLDADGKLKKPAKLPTVKVVDGGYYRDGKGKIHGPMKKMSKSEMMLYTHTGLNGFSFEGKLRNKDGKPCSKAGSGLFFDHRGKAYQSGKNNVNDLIERVTSYGDKFDDSDFD